MPNPTTPILVSACLLGLPCRYDGTGKADERLIALAKTHTFIPVCPEQLGGLPTPRPSAELYGARVFRKFENILGLPQRNRMQRLDCTTMELDIVMQKLVCG